MLPLSLVHPNPPLSQVSNGLQPLQGGSTVVTTPLRPGPATVLYTDGGGCCMLSHTHTITHTITHTHTSVVFSGTVMPSPWPCRQGHINLTVENRLKQGGITCTCPIRKTSVCFVLHMVLLQYALMNTTQGSLVFVTFSSSPWPGPWLLAGPWVWGLRGHGLPGPLSAVIYQLAGTQH
jgi:hypothetical protein